jgi:YbgC/YbaW family acyl-CoA thioester hydrolase
MAGIFTRTFRVRWAEVGAIGQVRTSSYLRYLVETALDWGASGHLGLDDMDALGQVWVVRETECTMVRPLRYDDLFEFTIWLVTWRRVFGTRAFELTLKDSGEVVGQGVQQVVCLDAQTMRPTRPPEDVEEHFRPDSPRVLAHQRFPRVPPAPQGAFVMSRTVQWQDLDRHEIVNNAVYADYAEEAATRALAAVEWSLARLKGEGLAVATRRVHLQYQSPAVWGDPLEVVTYLLELGESGGVRYVAVRRATDGAGIVECVLDWALIDRASGEAQRLPASLAAALQDTVAGAEMAPRG